MYERKQNGEVFFSSLCVTYSRFGNYPANGLVTEQPQYSVVVCIFHILQNTEIQLISNDLRLIFTCSLLLASPCIFHCSRHTFATTITLSHGIPIETVSKMLGHTSIKTTQIYAKILDTKVMDDMAALKEMYARKESQESPSNKAANE
nr:tyrosine-type recombinase/integrase [Bacteroides thetaiotaomicron]